MTATLSSTRYEDARRAMIDSQLRTSGITDPLVIARMGVVAREAFVPEARRAAAYADRTVRLPGGGALPPPLFHGLLLSEARPSREDRAIVVDGGSGYLSALVEPMVAALETVSAGDAAAGRTATADATLLLIDGAIEHLPEALAARLAPDARVVTGLVERGVTRLAAGRKAGGAVALAPLAEIGAPRLLAFDREAVWRF